MEDILQVRTAYRYGSGRGDYLGVQIKRDEQKNRRGNGISENTFYYWRRKMRTAAAGISPKIIELLT